MFPGDGFFAFLCPYVSMGIGALIRRPMLTFSQRAIFSSSSTLNGVSPFILRDADCWLIPKRWASSRPFFRCSAMRPRIWRAARLAVGVFFVAMFLRLSLVHAFVFCITQR